MKANESNESIELMNSERTKLRIRIRKQKNNAENKKTKKVNEEKIENWCVTKWNEEDRANEDKVKWKQWFKTNGWCMNRTQIKSSDKIMKWKK